MQYLNLPSVNIKHGARLRAFSLKAAGQAASACGANVRLKLGLPSVQFAMKQEVEDANLLKFSRSRLGECQIA